MNRKPIDAQTDPQPGDIVERREVILRFGERIVYWPPSRAYKVRTTLATWKGWATAARVDRVAP